MGARISVGVVAVMRAVKVVMAILLGVIRVFF
jgi:hypothetical protein